MSAGGWSYYNVFIYSLQKQRTFSGIRLFPMLVATGSFSPESGLPVIFCVDFNHFKSIIMIALLHRKTLICSFLNQFRLLFICYQRIFNLLKPYLWICHSNMIRMYRKMDRKSTFTHAATWWSSTLESSEYITHSNHVTSKWMGSHMLHLNA